MKEITRSLSSESIRRTLERVEVATDKTADIVKQSLEGKVFGQEEACWSVARAVARHETGLNDPNRPLGVLFFAGPTGVGKTEMAHALTDYLFPTGHLGVPRLKIIDCAQFSEQHTIARFVGSPPGYVGYGDQPIFTPDFLFGRNVIVFDEIEKAHPQLHRLLLSIMEDGRLVTRAPKFTNHMGNLSREIGETELNFSNSYIIFTSNIGAREINRKSLGFVPEKAHSMKSTVKEAIETHFQFMPEFLGRIDEVIIFNPLNKEGYIKIVYKYIDEINIDLQRQVPHAPYLAITKELATDLIKCCGKYGARDLRMTINKRLLHPLSDVLPALYGRIGLVADLEGDEVIFYQSPKTREPSSAPEDGE